MEFKHFMGSFIYIVNYRRPQVGQIGSTTSIKQSVVMLSFLMHE